MPRRGYWPTYIGGKNFETTSRQRRRYVARKTAFAQLHRDFGGTTDRGGYYYPEGMGRQIMRQIARDKAS